MRKKKKRNLGYKIAQFMAGFYFGFGVFMIPLNFFLNNVMGLICSMFLALVGLLLFQEMRIGKLEGKY